MERKNYRPVAILSPLSKVLEKVIYEQVYNYFTKFSLFHPNLHGYRKNRSTQTALLQVYDRWVRASNEGKFRVFSGRTPRGGIRRLPTPNRPTDAYRLLLTAHAHTHTHTHTHARTYTRKHTRTRTQAHMRAHEESQHAHELCEYSKALIAWYCDGNQKYKHRRPGKKQKSIQLSFTRRRQSTTPTIPQTTYKNKRTHTQAHTHTHTHTHTGANTHTHTRENTNA